MKAAITRTVIIAAVMIFLFSPIVSLAQEEGMLTAEQKKTLLDIARKSIEDYVAFGKKYEPQVTDPQLLEPRGAFVTLKERGELRGCIGFIEPIMPLASAVAQLAVESAVRDPRFAPLKANEVGAVTIEISALSVPKLIKDVNEIEVGKHGLIIEKGFYHGVLLPQVATEYNWDRQEFLANVCYKAGLPPDAWQKGAKIYTFTAEVFHEE